MNRLYHKYESIYCICDEGSYTCTRRIVCTSEILIFLIKQNVG